MSNYRSDELGRFAEAFKALSNPHRLRIFNILSNCCETGTDCSLDEAHGCCVGELTPQLDIAASTLSHHLKELYRAGLIDMRRDGKQVYCKVNPGMLKEIRILFKLYEQKTRPAHGRKNT